MSMPSRDHQSTDLEAGPLSDIHTSNSDNTAKPNPPGKSQCHADKKEGSTSPDWREIYHDAVELESLLFCVRRPTSRDRLFKLVHNLKQLSGKLKRCEEVTAQLNRKDETMIQNADCTYRKRNRIDHLTAEENEQESHDDCNLPKRKRPRAIPLDSFTFDQKVGTGSKLSIDASNSNTISNPELKFPESLDSTAEPPSLKLRDKWVQHHAKGSNLHCPDFDASNSCPLGKNCNFLHIFTPRKPHPAQEDGNKVMVKYRYTKEDVDSVYEIYRNVSLGKADHAEKIKCDGRSNPNYSFSITCPIDRTVYYACPFPGDAFVKANKNRQGIWWYTTMKDAKDAVSTLIICNLKERGIVPKDYKPREITIGGDWDAGKRSAKALQLARKALSGKTKEKIMAPPILPNITPYNFMESGYEKRCSQFNSQQGCSFGSKCAYAHVHFHSGKVSNEFPTKDALPRAYRKMFQMDLDSFFQGSSIRNGKSPFHVMTAVDNRGDLWYTAALKCPREGTIYYAAGGSTGMVNKQNMVLYRSMEEAKLAVCGIVLDSFKERGLVTNKITQAHEVTKTNQSTPIKTATAPPPPPKRVNSTRNQQNNTFNLPQNTIHSTQYSGMIGQPPNHHAPAAPLLQHPQQITQNNYVPWPDDLVIQHHHTSANPLPIHPVLRMPSSSLPPPPPRPPPPPPAYGR